MLEILRCEASLSIDLADPRDEPPTRHWFPVASTLELDPKRPTPVRVDGSVGRM